MRFAPYLRLLRRNPDFARFYVAQLVSFAGDWFATVALLGLVLETTGSGGAAAAIIVLQEAPFFLVSPLAGVLADRFDRRRLMIGADLARVVICLAFLLARDASSLPIAFVAVALLSAVSAVFEPASSAALPNLVDRDDLPLANALGGSAWGTMLAVGAALGGAVTVALGRDAAFLADAASFAVSAALLYGIRRPFAEARSGTGHHLPGLGPGGIARATREVIELARASRLVAAFLLAKTTFSIGAGAIVLLAVFGSDVYGAGDAGIGLLFAARGVGALIGPFLARALVGDDDRGLLRGIAAAFAVFIVGYGLLPLAPSIWLAAGLVMLAHLGGGAQWTLSTLGLQRAAPDRIRGRVLSLDFALLTLTMTVSTLASGALVETVGPTGAIWVLMAAGLVASGAWFAWTRALRSGRADEPALDG
ncbi:MAG: hypothetical protein A2X23_03820 [Chloroflexi bacterium GWC2_73_18]|nr:MAG: hypothetical protein A2X23_03820 [Chloroflexi bacterium GWC2_73_18]